MPSIEVNGADLFYVEQGIGPTTVIMGHGLLVSSKLWRDYYFPRLPRSWHIIAPDFRGHGQSASVQQGCRFGQMSEDIAAIVASLGVKKYFYVGLSMGCGVGLQLAVNHPDCVQGLVLISPVTGLGRMGNAFMTAFGPHMARQRWLLKLALGQSLTTKPAKAELDRAVDDAMVVTAATLRDYLSRDNVIHGTDRFHQFSFPSLVIIGGRDKVIPVRQQERLAEILPNCTKVMLPDFGHGAAGENPDAVAAHITRFIDGIAGI